MEISPKEPPKFWLSRAVVSQPCDNQQRPLQGMAVPVQPQPDPDKVGKAVAHGQPQQKPKGVRSGHCPGVEQQIKAAVVHNKVENPSQRPATAAWYRRVKSSTPSKKSKNSTSSQIYRPFIVLAAMTSIGQFLISFLLEQQPPAAAGELCRAETGSPFPQQGLTPSAAGC